MSVLDYINQDTLEYRFNRGYLTRYGFDWRLVFFETFFRDDQIGPTPQSPRPWVLWMLILSTSATDSVTARGPQYFQISWNGRSVQSKTESMRLEKPICAPSRLSEVFPTLHCSSEWRWSSLVLWRALPLSTPLSSQRSMVWCHWLCARRQCLKLLSISDLRRRKPLVIVAFLASLSARSFPITPACPGQHTHRSLNSGINLVRGKREMSINIF